MGIWLVDLAGSTAGGLRGNKGITALYTSYIDANEGRMASSAHEITLRRGTACRSFKSSSRLDTDTFWGGWKMFQT